MHIPDGYLSPQTYVPMYGLTVIGLSIALKRMKTEVSAKYVPYLAMAAAFSFLIQMFNIPTPGGTTGHAVGAGIVALLLGPWTAVVAVSVVLIIQALIFGDGGITAIGANCFTMAIVMPFVSWWVFRAVAGKSPAGGRFHAAAFLSGYLGLTVAAVCAAFLLGIQPLIASGPDGRPLYAPYPLAIAVPVMALEHLFLFGIIEGIVTLLLMKYFLKNDSALICALKRGPE
ncbi:MAG: cobalt transporter CbiM [Syntrophales bacterium]|nr:cobalt transporter CbiM [Syntrophales bacterium]